MMTPEQKRSLDNYIDLMQMSLRANTERLRDLDARVKYLRHFRWIQWVEKLWLEAKYEAKGKVTEITEIEESLSKAYYKRMGIKSVIFQSKLGKSKKVSR